MFSIIVTKFLTEVNTLHSDWSFNILHTTQNTKHSPYSQKVPVYSGLHLHLYGLTHIPPFRQYGKQIAMKKMKDTKYSTI